MSFFVVMAVLVGGAASPFLEPGSPFPYSSPGPRALPARQESAPALEAAGRVVEIRIHGNHTTADAEVVTLSGLTVGEPATAERLQAAEQMLRASDRFDTVEVRRRYLSIDDPAAVLVMIVVNEHDAVTPSDPLPGPLRRLKVATMWLPILSYADGYGFTYGVRLGFTDPLGPQTRISVPLTWGGERRAGMEVERTFERQFVSRISGSLSTYRRINPHYDVADSRLEARGRVERVFTRWVRAGVNGRTARVDFAGAAARHSAAGWDVVFDTRLDPSFPRNAVYALVGWERLAFDEGNAGRWLGDVRAYIGAGGSNVLALRAQFARASSALPVSEQPLLGGSGSLRGYRTGHRAGDSLAAVSAELRVPLNSPLSVGRFGVKGFVDAGTTWASAERLRDQAFDRGVGGGIYFGVAAFTIDVDVAWPEGGGARTHVGFGLTF